MLIIKINRESLKIKLNLKLKILGNNLKITRNKFKIIRIN